MDADAVPRAPLRPDWSAGKSTHKFVELPERLVLKHKVRTELLLTFVFLAVGWVGSRHFFGEDASWPMRLFGYHWLVGSSLLGLLFAIIAALRLKRGMHATFDLVRAELRVTGGRFPGGLTVQFRDVVALQIVSGGTIEPSEGHAWRPHELNVAWQRDGGMERACLLCHGDLDAIRRQAGRISERIGAPVVDHAAARDAEVAGPAAAQPRAQFARRCSK